MKIALAAPARKVTPHEVDFAVEWLESMGMEPVFDHRLFATHHIFAGTDELRAAVIQEYMDRTDIDAIWLARGGYGSIQIIDKLDFGTYIHHPKPFIGFSDTTVFHGMMQRLGIPSIHAAMPWNLENKTQEALQSLHDALVGKPFRHEWPSYPLNRLCDDNPIKGELVGGNLSVLYGMLGSCSFPDTDGKILFIEEVDEYIYHVERMMYGLKRAGKLNKLKALLIGGLTEIHDNPDPFGKKVEQAIFDVVRDYDYPVCFGVPAGHHADNRALLFGKESTLIITSASSSILF